MESICKKQQQACFVASLLNIFLPNFLPVAFIEKLIKCLFVLSVSFWPSLFLGNLLTTWNSMKRTKILWILVVGSWGYIHLTCCRKILPCSRKAVLFSTVLLPTIPSCTAILFLPKLSKQCHFYKKRNLKKKQNKWLNHLIP